MFLPAFLQLRCKAPFHAPDGQGNRDGCSFKVVARLLRKGDLHAGAIDGRKLRHLFHILDAKGLEDFQAFGLRSESVLFSEPENPLKVSEFRYCEIGFVVPCGGYDIPKDDLSTPFVVFLSFLDAELQPMVQTS